MSIECLAPGQIIQQNKLGVQLHSSISKDRLASDAAGITYKIPHGRLAAVGPALSREQQKQPGASTPSRRGHIGGTKTQVPAETR